MSDFREKILGAWRNSEIEYDFKADGTIAIYYFIIKTADKGNWQITGNKIDFTYGPLMQYEKSLEINYITDTEILINDKYNNLRNVIFMEKVAFDDTNYILGRNYEGPALNENPSDETVTKKTVEDKMLDFFGSTLGIGFFIMLLIFMAYLVYEDLSVRSSGFINFIIGLLLMLIAFIFSIKKLPEKSTNNQSVLIFIYMFSGICIGIPLLLFLLYLLGFLLNLWFFIVLLAAFFASFVVIVQDLKALVKVFIVILFCASIYFFFHALGVFEIKFGLYIDNRKIGF